MSAFTEKRLTQDECLLDASPSNTEWPVWVEIKVALGLIREGRMKQTYITTVELVEMAGMRPWE